MIRAGEIRRGGGDGTVTVTLDYEARFLRRKVLIADNGLKLLLDLENTTSLEAGDAILLGNGSHITVRAAAESLLAITGPDLTRLAWHIGNRHTPCQIGAERLLIQRDPVIGHMLEHLGATLTEVTEPFSPEGGAYGHGRTHSHDQGATTRVH